MGLRSVVGVVPLSSAFAVRAGADSSIAPRHALDPGVRFVAERRNGVTRKL